MKSQKRKTTKSKLILDLGCGMKKITRQGYKTIGIDNRKFKGVDHVLHLGKDKLPYDDDTFYEIHASHLLEHLYPEELFHLMDEAWRVCKPEGVFYIDVPKGDTLAFYVHPDHKIPFLPETFSFFQVPYQGKDPHGYISGFWHVTAIVNPDNPHALKVELYPNKEGGRYEYVKVAKNE